MTRLGQNDPTAHAGTKNTHDTETQSQCLDECSDISFVEFSIKWHTRPSMGFVLVIIKTFESRCNNFTIKHSMKTHGDCQGFVVI